MLWSLQQFGFSKHRKRKCFYGKRAMGDQVDWAISLAIFIVFTFWFFIVLRHYTHSDARLESEVNIIEERFKNSVSFEFFQTPMFVISERNLSNVPILVRNPLPKGNFTYTLNQGIYSLFDDENIFFMTNITMGVNPFLIKRSENEYQMPYPGDFLYKSGDTVSVDSKSFHVRYPSNILKEIFFQDKQQIFDFNFTIDGQYSDVVSTGFEDKTAFIKHNASTDWFLYRSYVFAENSYVLNLLDVAPRFGSNLTLTLKFEIPRYETYYIDSIVPYNLLITSECVVISSEILDLISEDAKGITFIFDREVEFRICDESSVLGEKIMLYLDLIYLPSEVSTRTNFVLYSHNESYASTRGNIITPNDMRYGARERFKGISHSKLLVLTDKTPSQLLELWNLSDDVEFSIEVQTKENNVLFNFETSNPGVTDVFSRTFTDYLIDQYGEREFVFVNIKIW